MAEREAKLKFTAETQELNSNIKQSENSLKEFRSELKLNASEMKTNGENSNSLKSRLNILGSEMQSAKDKTQAVSDKLDVAKDVFGENSVEAQRLQIQLNNCKTVENGIQSDINETTNRLNEQKEANSDLNSQLETLDNTIESTSSELEVNAAQLENAENNTDLLKERMSLLQEEYDASSEKVELLSTALEESANTSGTATEEYHNLETALQQATIEHENIKSEISSTEESMHGSNITIGDMIEGFKNIPGPAGIAVATIKEIGGACLDAAEDMKTGYDEMIEKTGATGDSLEELKTVMEDVYGKLPTDTQTAGSAVGELKTRFSELSNDELERLTEKFTKFSDITNTDVSNAIALASQTMGKYGLDVSDVDSYLDKIASTSQKTGIDTNSLMNTVMQNSDVFKTYGMSIDEAIEFTGRMESKGISASSVLSQMRTKADDLAKASETTARDGLNQLAESINNASNDTEALGIASDVFSGRQANKMMEAAQLGALNFNDLSDSASNCSGTVDSTFEATQNGADKAKVSMNNLKMAGGSLGDTFLDKIASPAIDFVTPSLQDMADGFNGNQEAADKTKERFNLLNASSFLLCGGIEGLAASLWITSDDTKEASNQLKEGVGKEFDELKKGAVEDFNELKESATEKFNDLKSSGIEKFNDLKTKTTDKIEELKIEIPEKLDAMKTNALSKFDDLKNGAKDKIDAMWSKVSGVAEKLKKVFDFKWSLPDLKIPHISVSGGVAPYGIAGLGKLPSFDIKWYAKGGIFTKPTLLSGTNGISGVGEAGAEAVLPIDRLYGYVEEAVVNTMSNFSTPIDYELMRDMFVEGIKNVKFSAKVGNRELLRIMEDIT